MVLGSNLVGTLTPFSSFKIMYNVRGHKPLLGPTSPLAVSSIMVCIVPDDRTRGCVSLARSTSETVTAFTTTSRHAETVAR